MKNRSNSFYWEVQGIPFISELFEKTSRQLMGTPAMSAEFCGQRGQLCITITNPISYSFSLIKFE
jgi:hypothetical protein